MEKIKYQVGLLAYKIIAWVGLIFFLSMAMMSWIFDAKEVAPWFLIFVVIGLYMLLSASSIDFTDKYIRVNSPYSTYQIEWDVVRWIEIGNQGGIVVHGNGDKRLVLPPAMFWSGKQKPDAYNYFGHKVESNKLTVVPSFTADYKVHKNVKIKNA